MARAIFSSAWDDAYAYAYAAIRYVERTPIEASRVDKVEDYVWSRAAHHCGVVDGDILEGKVEEGRLCGSDSFIDRLESLTKRSLHYRPQGRPTKEA
jgi:hypothetical protein